MSGSGFTWSGADGGSWSASGNWVQGTTPAVNAPGSLDLTQFISFTGTVTGSVGSQILDIGPGSNLALGGSGFFNNITVGQDFDFDTGAATLTIGSGVVVSATLLNVGSVGGGGGTLLADGTFSTTGGINLGSPGFAATIQVNSGGEVMDSASNLTMGNGGLISVAQSGEMILGSTGVSGAFSINSGHVFTGVGTIAANVVDNGSLATANFGNSPTVLAITGNVTGSGSLAAVQELDIGGSIGSGVDVSLFGNGGANAGLLRLAQPTNDAGTLVTMSTNSTIALTGLSFDDAVWTPGSLTMTGASGTLTLATAGDHSHQTFMTQSDAVSGTDIVVLVCFLASTQIATPAGELAVERLAVGDAVTTLRGEVRRIVWIGEGRVLATRGRRTAATPVIVRKSSLSDNVPHHDLRVTKGHSLYIDGILIPVEFLVNHRTILWDDHASEVTIYHIELETHDVLVANGAPAESYRDDGNRWLFQNANPGWTLPPQAPCAPVLTGGPVVDGIWRRLLDRAGPHRGVPLTDDPDLHLWVDGKRIDPLERTAERCAFRLPPRPRSVRLRSRSAVPQELGVARDDRCLGVAVQSDRAGASAAAAGTGRRGGGAGRGLASVRAGERAALDRR